MLLLRFFSQFFFYSKIDQAVIGFLFHNQFDFISLYLFMIYIQFPSFLSEVLFTPTSLQVTL